MHHLNHTTLQGVLEEYKEVFEDTLGTLKGYKAKLHIDQTVPPKFCKSRPVPYSMQALVDEELDRLVKDGVIEPIQHSDWAAPIVPVLKSDKKSVRICGDFKQTVNQASHLDKYPIPKVEDLFAKLAGGERFTKLDMSQAYQQLELDEDSKQYVVINTHRGLFRYNRLPYGISSAPGIFQRTMENLLKDIPNTVVYIDDILITGATEEEHLQTLVKVLKRLREAGLKLKKKKCSFFARSVVYLGHKIDAKGLHPMSDKLQAVQEAPQPNNVSELKSYIGLLSYYGKFLPRRSTTLAPLYSLLCKDKCWRWTAQHEAAFLASKELLTSSQVLVHFDPTKPLVLSCDASQYGVGAVLAHRTTEGLEQPIGFASRTLSAAEKNYSQIEREGLACVFGVKRFHSYLYGHKFELITDHKPLLSLFNEKRSISPQASGRIQRWALLLSMYEYTMAFKPTQAHGNADALSRLPLPQTPRDTPQPAETVLMMEHLNSTPITATRIRALTQTDPLLSRVKQFVQHGWPNVVKDDSLKPFWHRKVELSCQDGCILWGNRVVVPKAVREEVLRELHDAHPGETRMKRLARMFVWWPGIIQEIEATVKKCPQCQKNRANPPLAPLMPWHWPTRPWSRLHIDFAGPFQNNMYLVLIDSHSKWIEVHVMPTITASATIKCLRGIFAQFGLPERIVTDNGSTFTSQEFKQFLRKNGIQHTTPPPYHPASNGLAERAVKTFKEGVKKLTGDMHTRIARFLFNYRISPQSTTGVSPAELLMGRRLRSALDLLKPDLESRVSHQQIT